MVMLELTTPAGRTYGVDLLPLRMVVPMPPDNDHAYVVALTCEKEEDAKLLRFTAITPEDDLGSLMTGWQRIGATHYGVVAERDPRDARALVAELAQLYGVSSS